jgi:hypothetical protein
MSGAWGFQALPDGRYAIGAATDTAANETDGEMFVLHEVTSSEVTLQIQSANINLSAERISEILTCGEMMYWGYVNNASRKLHGYFGICFPAGGRKPGSTGTIHPELLIYITWPRQSMMHLLKRLRLLAKEGGISLPFWPALVGAIVATDQAQREGLVPENHKALINSPAFYAKLNVQVSRYFHPDTRIEAIRALARSVALARNRSGHPTHLPKLDACGSAFYWLELGKALWSPECIRNGPVLLSWLREEGIPAGFFADVADHWLNMVSFGIVEIGVAGIKMKYDLRDIGTVKGLWVQTIELERSRISAEGVRYLHARQSFSPYTPPYTVIHGFDSVYGDALAQQLVVEAQEKSVFVPIGGFRTRIPPTSPLTGVEELCLWCDGKGLWVLPQPDGLIFHWKPEPGHSFYESYEDNRLLSAWNLILAALWHDLVTAGPAVMVRMGDEPLRHIQRKTHKRHGPSGKRTHVLHLPSQRVIYLDGIHAWGTPEEIEKIKRQAHQVRGHRRRLLPGHRRSSYALENAGRFNFIIPDGYTFVKPHQTGFSGSGNDAASETPILARGLASLMLMNKDTQPGSAA